MVTKQKRHNHITMKCKSYNLTHKKMTENPMFWHEYETNEKFRNEILSNCANFYVNTIGIQNMLKAHVFINRFTEKLINDYPNIDFQNGREKTEKIITDVFLLVAIKRK